MGWQDAPIVGGNAEEKPAWENAPVVSERTAGRSSEDFARTDPRRVDAREVSFPEKLGRGVVRGGGQLARGMGILVAGPVERMLEGGEHEGKAFAAADDFAKWADQATAPKGPETSSFVSDVGEKVGEAAPIIGGALLGGPAVAGVIGTGTAVGNTWADNMRNDVSTGVAAAQTAIAGVTNLLGSMLPGSVGANVPAKFASGGAINAATGEAQRVGQNIVYEQAGRQDLTQAADKAQVAADLIVGGATAGAHTRQAQTETEAKAKKAKALKLDQPSAQGIVDANKAGYILTPTEAKQGGAVGGAATAVEGLAGEPALAKSVSRKNAETTNKLVRQDVGLADDEPVTRENLARLRAKAGEKYAVLKKVDTIDNDSAYFKELDEITKSYDTAAESFPHRSENPFQKVIDGLRQQSMTGAAAVEEVKLLRGDADKAYRQGDKGLGRAYRDAANALDNSIERHLTKMAAKGDDPSLAKAVGEYRAARKQIAKTYLADAGLNDTTGNVDAAAYARALKRAPGKLDGPGLTIARAATQFPRLFQKPERLGNSGGPTIGDAAIALLSRAGGKGSVALDVATAAARPVTRAVLQSEPVQTLLTRRARKEAKRFVPAKAAPTAPPPEPTTSPGAGGPRGGGGGGTPPRPGPLGDLTPDWQTTPGAGGGKPRGGLEPGLVRPVDEPSPTTGNRKAPLQIPAVPGRPDLPDTMVTGGPAEVAATERANKAMNEPGAIEARAQQAEAAERARRAAEPRVPAGEVKEGQPPIKAEKTGKIPVGKATEGQPEIKPLVPKKPIKAGEATELPVERIEPKEPIPEGEIVPLTPEQEKAWRKEFGLGDGDAERAKAVAAALKHDAEAVEKAAVQHDNSPRAFDREIARITEEGEARANEVKQAADSGEGNAAKSDAAAATEAAGEQRRPDSDAAAGAGGEQAPAGGQAKAGEVEIREVPGGFEAYRDGKKVGYLKDNLERGQAKQLGESANVDMVKVDKDEQGKGTGRALYAAFSEKHEGAIMPSGKTEPSAWKLWKRNYPEKVDAFVKQEAKRIADGADPNIVARNITDPEVRQRVLQEAQDGKRLQPDDLQPAAKEKGKPEAEPPEEVFATEKEAPFYSPLSRAIGDLKMERAPAQGWLDTIKGLTSKGIKADEVEWSGVKEWLATREGKVTKAELQSFLKEGGVKVEEVQKGALQPKDIDRLNALDARVIRREALTPDEQAEYNRLTDAESLPHTAGGRATKYETYQLPGGKNYREVLLTLPAESPEQIRVRMKAKYPEWREGQSYKDVFTPEDQRAFEASLEGTDKNYKSPHWDEPNVLAHIRLNDRVDAQGRKVLFVEEVQSDWAQRGKRTGFVTKEDRAAIAAGKAKYAELKRDYDKLEQERQAAKDALTVEARRLLKATHPGLYEYSDLLKHRDRVELTAKYRKMQETDPEFLRVKADVEEFDTEQRALYAKMVEAERPEGESSNKVPGAPFVGKTDAWTALAIKRITKMAVDEGYDRVAFINGEQSASRYDLSKQVSEVHYDRGTGELVALGGPGDDVVIREHVAATPEALEPYIGKEAAEKLAKKVAREDERNAEDRKAWGSELDEDTGRWFVRDSNGEAYYDHNGDMPTFRSEKQAEAAIDAHFAEETRGEYARHPTLRGLDLKVGGEGMKAFYDKIVPNVAKDVVRKLGGDGITTADIPGPNMHADYDGQVAFDITDKMRENAAGGVPLFKGEGGYGAKPLGSPEATEAVLRDKFGSKLIDGLLEQGLLKFALALDEGRTRDIGQGGVKAVFSQKPGEKPYATLYFDRLTAEQAPGMLMHELGEHFGAPRLIGEQRYHMVMGELKKLAETDTEVKEAWQHVKDNYIGEGTPNKIKEGDDTFMREVAAHLVETQPDLPWVRRLVNEIRAFFYEHFGTTMGNRVDANLIRGMAAAALRKASTGGLAGQRPTPRQFKPFVPSRTAGSPPATLQ